MLRLRSVEILRAAVMRSVEGLRCGYDEFNRLEFFFLTNGIFGIKPWREYFSSLMCLQRQFAPRIIISCSCGTNSECFSSLQH